MSLQDFREGGKDFPSPENLLVRSVGFGQLKAAPNFCGSGSRFLPKKARSGLGRLDCEGLAAFEVARLHSQ